LRWAIEAFFKTAKHQFGLHCFGQGTRLGVFRWLILSLIAYVLAHWIDRWASFPVLDWKATCELTRKKLFPIVVWKELLKHIQNTTDITAQFGFEIVLQPLPDKDYQEWCKI
ncbi:MAG: transposase, partial [Cyanobacteria bacterium P01_G01_bin.38]